MSGFSKRLWLPSLFIFLVALVAFVNGTDGDVHAHITSPQSFIPIINQGIFPPPNTVSYYIQDASAIAMYTLGCAVGNQIESISHPHPSMLIILFFGQPWYQNSEWGTRTFDIPNFTFRSTAEINLAVRNFVAYYVLCNDDWFQYELRVAVGTSNYGPGVTSSHALVWGAMVNDLYQWADDVNYYPYVNITGASDMELAFNSPATTRDWVDSFHAIRNPYVYFYNFGAAEGCPPYGDCGALPYLEWTQEDVWYISAKIPGASRVAPQIYLEDGGNAAQWFEMSLYGYEYHGEAMSIDSSLTQQGACKQRPQDCYLDNNAPEQGWRQLTLALQSDTRTSYPIPYSTDIRYQDQ